MQTVTYRSDSFNDKVLWVGILEVRLLSKLVEDQLSKDCYAVNGSEILDRSISCLVFARILNFRFESYFPK